MNKAIDRTQQLSWCLEFSNNERWFDCRHSEGETEWARTKKEVEDGGLCIKRLHLFSKHNVTGDTTFNGANTEREYSPHIFFSNKSVGWMGEETSNHCGIGWQIDNKMVIVWYDQHMSCYNREERDVDPSSPFIIKNNTHDRNKRV